MTGDADLIPAQDFDQMIVEALRSIAEPDARPLADTIAGVGLRQLPVHDQLTAIRITARHAADIENNQPQVAAGFRLAAVTAAEATGISTVWGAEPNINPDPAVTHIRNHGDAAQLEAVLRHTDTMHREARTGVMLAGYTDPHQAEMAQRQRFVDLLTSLGLPDTVVDQIRTNPLANPPELAFGRAAADPVNSDQLSVTSRRRQQPITVSPQRAPAPTF